MRVLTGCVEFLGQLVQEFILLLLVLVVWVRLIVEGLVHREELNQALLLFRRERAVGLLRSTSSTLLMIRLSAVTI